LNGLGLHERGQHAHPRLFLLALEGRRQLLGRDLAVLQQHGRRPARNVSGLIRPPELGELRRLIGGSPSRLGCRL